MDELPLLDFEQKVEAAAAKIQPASVRNAARNAFNHLRKAWRLKDLDPEMAVFRVITAQEEAATALMLGLKRQTYPGARLLKHRDHQHKVAILTTFLAAQAGLAKRNFPEAQVTVSIEPPRVEVSFDLAKMTGREGPLRAVLVDPFDLVTRMGTGENAIVHAFDNDLAALASDVGAGDIVSEIDRRANRRNLLLYASEEALPSAQCSPEYIIARTHLVAAVIVVLIGVLQTTRRQSMVVQCLDGLLRALNKAESLDFHYPGMEPTIPGFALWRQQDGIYKVQPVGPCGPVRCSFQQQYRTWSPGWSRALQNGG